MATTTQSIVLGKRKRSVVKAAQNLRIYLSGASSSDTDNTGLHSDFVDEPEDFVPAKKARSTGESRDRKWICTHTGCAKSYTKPSRLAEHQRSHTGERPYKCSQCPKSYLRETHLHAHTRVHLPSSAREYKCPEAGCGKSFWTAQHLKVHDKVHSGEKTFACHEEDCDERFTKHHQLRTHIIAAHSPPGTKAYPCLHEGCTKSFATSQKLKAHAKVHDEERYTCLYPTCLPTQQFFPTWSALLSHNRSVHRPTCSACGRTFSATKNLRAHMVVHEQREIEAMLNDADDESGKSRRRRGGEVGRDWECEVEGCEKAFKSKKALRTHHHITHLQRRDFVCHIQQCEQTFGYKHLLQRHIERSHTQPDSDSDPDSDPASASDDASGSEDDEPSSPIEPPPARNSGKEKKQETWSIEFITGQAYTTSLTAIHCPYPSVFGPCPSTPGQGACMYTFKRAYDLRRHLRAEHEVECGKDEVDEWVNSSRDRDA